MTAQNIAPFNHHNLSKLVSNGQIFSVEFVKRSTGELRKHLKGGSKPYSAKVHNLLTVFDMERNGYRSIPIENILKLTISGQTFSFGQ